MTSHSDQSQRAAPLNESLREAAAQAAEIAMGGCALLYAALPGEPDASQSNLRAAAGFASPEAARSAAESMRSRVRETIAQRRPHHGGGESALGPRGQAAVQIVPLAWNESVRGALVVGSPEPISTERSQRLDGIAARLGLRLDHDHLEVQTARTDSPAKSDSGEDGGDEVLRLSEALFAQDIELLRSNEKLGKIEKLKSDFIEKMSCELRTPLNSIIEATISVLAGENDRLSDAGKASLRAALDDGAAFQRTLQNILDLWRIKQGELPVELSEVNFREIVEEAIFSVQDTLGDKPISIEKSFEEPFPKLKADVAKTNQILFLLLENAVKFTREGKIEIRAEVGDGSLSCTIEDTGIGICPDDQQFIFDEFFQVDEFSSSAYRGAGLGLALVQDLLILLEGEISLSSEAGRGTRVTFRLPVQAL